MLCINLLVTSLFGSSISSFSSFPKPIKMYMISFFSLSPSNKFGQKQELKNDNYSDIKLYSVFHIEYKDIEFITSTNEPTFAWGCIVIVSI